MQGSNSADTLTGSDGADTPAGNGDGDAIAGGGGDDRLTGGGGNDAIDGGNGTDTVDYGPSPAGSSVDLSAGRAWNEGYPALGVDTLSSVETVQGSAGNDVFTGSDLADSLYGNAGNDVLYGLGGNDYLDEGPVLTIPSTDARERTPA